MIPRVCKRLVAKGGSTHQTANTRIRTANSNARASKKYYFSTSTNGNVEQEQEDKTMSPETQVVITTPPGPLNYGEGVVLQMLGPGRSYAINALTKGRTFENHFGSISHDDIVKVRFQQQLHCQIGMGGKIQLSNGKKFKTFLVRPPVFDFFVVRQKRAVTPIYPKDFGAILNFMNIGPGCKVLEAGTGTGAMALLLSRIVGPTGQVVTYERRNDHHKFALEQAPKWDPNVANIKYVLGDVKECEDNDFDAVLLDMPDPTQVLEAVAQKVKLGRSVVVVQPQITQMVEISDYLYDNKIPLFLQATKEVLERDWAIAGGERKVARPAMSGANMIGHTMFISQLLRMSGNLIRFTSKRGVERNRNGEDEEEEEHHDEEADS